MLNIKSWAFLAAIALIFLSSCGVTETGNPCPSNDCSEPSALPPDQPAAEQGNAYQNTEFGVVITYPAGWEYVEGDDGASVEFTHGDTDITSATVSFEVLAFVPSSLLSYLSGKYPGRQFTSYDACAYEGYIYDVPTAGQNGGDAREYYFLSDLLYIHVTAEVFGEDLEGVEELLAGIVVE